MPRPTTLLAPDKLGGVASDQESIGARVRRLRREVDWTQVQLADAAGVSEATVSNIERNVAAKGDRDTLPAVLNALEAERQRQQGGHGPEPGTQLIEYLARRQDVYDVRMRRLGPNTRYYTVIESDPDADPEEVAAAIEALHKSERD